MNLDPFSEMFIDVELKIEGFSGWNILQIITLKAVTLLFFLVLAEFTELFKV